MLSDLCKELKNWFEKEKIFDTFTIQNGAINLNGIAQTGQYFRIVGSVFNDGVYQYPASNLTDEVFDGAVWLMAVPPNVITLASDIGEWVGKYADVVVSPYSSESVPNYSYTKSAGSAGAGDGSTGVTWQSAFANRLNQWRKV